VFARVLIVVVIISNHCDHAYAFIDYGAQYSFISAEKKTRTQRLVASDEEIVSAFGKAVTEK